MLEVAQLLPVFEKEPILTREQIKIAAYIFLRLYSQRAKQGNATQTKLLKPLKQCLWNSSTITQVLHEVNCLNKAWFGSEKYFVLSKHCLHVSRLLANKDKYLDAIDKAVQIFKEIDQDLVVCYGTLLGAVREKGFIPHDDDIDLLVLCNSQSRDESLVNGRVLCLRSLRGSQQRLQVGHLVAQRGALPSGAWACASGGAELWAAAWTRWQRAESRAMLRAPLWRALRRAGHERQGPSQCR